MAERIALNIGLTPGAWQFDDDTENLFPDRPLLEDIQDAASGARDVQPRKTLRDRQQAIPNQPLMVMPEYSGDFLKKLRRDYMNKSADSLLDFSSPEDWVKYLPTPMPRDLQDGFYDINRPGPGAGYDDLKDYHDRGWDEEDSPEISEDKILRMRNWNKEKKCPCLNPHNPSVINSANRVVNSYIREQDNFRARSVVANFLMKIIPYSFELDFQQIRVGKMLTDLAKTMIYTKTNGWRHPDYGSVSVRLVSQDLKTGKFKFLTTSGGEEYTTIFQFIPRKEIVDPTKLHVRVSCSCPSWVFWGAQYNAFTKDYNYGPVRLKFVPPKKRDPVLRFLVCKHALACIMKEFLAQKEKYFLKPVTDEEIYKRLTKPPEIKLELPSKKEKIRIPPEVLNFGKLDHIKRVVRNWSRMSQKNRDDFIFSLENPGEIAYMAYKFPEEATVAVVKKLKEIVNTGPYSWRRVQARKFLRDLGV